MYHRGKYQIVTPRPVRMVQNESCNRLVRIQWKVVRRTYTKVDISSSIKERRPREAAVEDLANGLVFFLLKDCVRYALLVPTCR